MDDIFVFPHVVVWDTYDDWNEKKQNELGLWFEENVRSDYVFVNAHKMTLGRKGKKEEKMGKGLIIAFEDPAEAIHFKLTWC